MLGSRNETLQVDYVKIGSQKCSNFLLLNGEFSECVRNFRKNLRLSEYIRNFIKLNTRKVWN